jgi:hypothetical protein
MAKMYKVLTTFQMGEPWGEGNKNISYWCQLEGLDDFAVKITKQKPLNPGDEVYGSLIAGDDGKPFLSQSGKPFMKFKGEMTPEGTPRPKTAAFTQTSEPASPTSAPAVHPSDDRAVPLWFAPFGVMIKAIYDEVVRPGDTPLTQHEVLTEAAKSDEPSETKPETEKIGGGEITKAELEDIFGGEMADPVDLTEDN